MACNIFSVQLFAEKVCPPWARSTVELPGFKFQMHPLLLCDHTLQEVTYIRFLERHPADAQQISALLFIACSRWRRLRLREGSGLSSPIKPMSPLHLKAAFLPIIPPSVQHLLPLSPAAAEHWPRSQQGKDTHTCKRLILYTSSHLILANDLQFGAPFYSCRG